MKENKLFQKLNTKSSNRGAALITVIIVMTVVALLGTLCLSLVYDSFLMRQVDKNATGNYYGAERILEGINSEIQSVVSDCYTKAYTEVMQKYNTYDTAEEMQMEYEKLFYQKLVATLQGTEIEGYYSRAIIQGYVSKWAQDTDAEVTLKTDAEGEKKTNFFDEAEGGMFLRNITVTYAEKGYTDKITTDIKITMPEVTFVKYANLPEISDYVVIANGGIDVIGGVLPSNTTTDESADSEENQYGTSNVMTGKVFAGLPKAEEESEQTVSININGTSALTFDNENETEVICEGDVELLNSGGFVTNENTTLWVNGVTAKAPEYDDNGSKVGGSNIIKMLGNTYIKDDTTLNGDYNKLTLGGRYYGYSGSRTDSSESSAIIINGTYSSLDLSQLDELIISGTAFVGSKGENNTYYSENLNDDVALGDSVAVKSNQLIYLVPKECDGIKTNPMTYAQYNALPSGWEQKALSTVIDGLGRSIASYGDVKITPVFTNKMGGAVYLYLEFSNPEASSAYFMDNLGTTESGKKAFKYLQNYVSAIQFTTSLSRLRTAGNFLIPANSEGTMMTYQDATGNMKDMELQDAYEQKCKELQFDELMDEDKIKAAIEAVKEAQTEAGIQTGAGTIADDDGGNAHSGYVVEKTVNGESIKVIVVDNKDSKDPYKINKSFDGIIIATGDVTVTGGPNMPINGLILCQGTLKIDVGVAIEFTADEDLVSQAIRLENEAGTSVTELFQGATETTSKVETDEEEEDVKEDVRNCVTFENWKSE